MVQTGENRKFLGSLAFTLALMCLKLVLVIIEGVLLVSSFSSLPRPLLSPLNTVVPRGHWLQRWYSPELAWGTLRMRLYLGGSWTVVA